jgi:hypothetical protein
MRRRIEQRLMFVLPVKLDQPRRQLLQRARGRQRAVNECAAAALSGDVAPDEQLLARGVEDGFNRCRVFAGPDQVAGRPAAEQQTDRFDQHRFSGAGLAGEDVQPRLEFDLGGIDHREMPNPQEAQHASSRNSNRSICLTAIQPDDTLDFWRCSQRRTMCISRRLFAHAWKPSAFPVDAGARRDRRRRLGHEHRHAGSPLQSTLQRGSADAGPFVGYFLGRHPLQALDIPAR